MMNSCSQTESLHMKATATSDESEHVIVSSYNVRLIPVSLVFVWGANNKLVKKGVTSVRPPQEAMRTSVRGGPCPEGNRRDIARSTSQNNTSL